MEPRARRPPSPAMYGVYMNTQGTVNFNSFVQQMRAYRPMRRIVWAVYTNDPQVQYHYTAILHDENTIRLHANDVGAPERAITLEEHNSWRSPTLENSLFQILEEEEELHGSDSGGETVGADSESSFSSSDFGSINYWKRKSKRHRPVGGWKESTVARFYKLYQQAKKV